MHTNGISASYFDSFGVEHIRKEIKRFIDNKNIRDLYWQNKGTRRIRAHTFMTSKKND